MSEGPASRARSRALVRAAAAAVWRSRLARAGAALLVLIAIPAAVGTSWMWGQALSTDCEAWERVDLPMQQVIGLRQRRDAYQRDAALEDEAFSLTDDEVTFLLRGSLAFDVRLWFHGSRVEALVVVPAETGCYNIHFDGTVSVDDGVAELVPERLRVGQADLTWLVGQRTFLVPPDRLPDALVASHLANVERLQIFDDQVHIRLHDPRRIW